MLNAKQRMVSDNREDHILLLAGAGTGKTNTLAARVAGLLADKVSGEEILCLTFTNRACKEMRERIALAAGDSAADVTIRTVHGFCAQLLREAPDGALEIGRNFSICDAADALEIIREVVVQRIGRSPDYKSLQILQNFIEIIKDCRLFMPDATSEEACGYALACRMDDIRRICTDNRGEVDAKFLSFLSKYGASILHLYDLKLARANLLDFSDLLIGASQFLQTAEALSWRGRYIYVHVDEVQDVSMAEYRLLTKLCMNAKVLFCGDFNQTIYQWRGSSPDELIAEFKAEYTPLEVVFEKNYRAGKTLLDVSQNFLHHAFGNVPATKTNPYGNTCEEIQIAQFDTLAEEVDWIYETISQLPTDDFSRVAVITRTNRACADICAHLKTSAPGGAAREVPFMLSDEAKLFSHMHIRTVLAALRVLYNPADSESLRRVLQQFSPKMEPAEVDVILTDCETESGVLLTDFADPRTHAAGDFFSPLLAALENSNLVVLDVESTGTDIYTDEIVQIAAVRIDMHGAVQESFEVFLRPGRPVGDSEQVHGFSDDFLQQNGIDPASGYEKLLDFLGDAVIVGHNVSFDLGIIAENLKRHRIGHAVGWMYYDTLDLSRRFLPKLENHKLATVASALGVSEKPTHNAMDDILATAQALVKLTDSYIRPQTAQRQAIYRKHLPQFAEISGILASFHKDQDAAQLLADVIASFGLRDLFAGEPEKLVHLELLELFAQEYTNPGDPPGKQLANLLELSSLSPGELHDSLRQNKVVVITVHQAKGCEFDYVFLPVLQDGVFPTFQANRAGDLSEEKRVFYVSLTRAKKRVFLSWPRYASNNFSANPSPFLKMLGP